MFHRSALRGWQSVDGATKLSGPIRPIERLFGIVAGIGVILICDRRMQLARPPVALAAHGIGGAAVCDGSEPSRKRPTWIVCLPCPMNRKQRFLNDIVNAIERYALPVRYAFDHRDASAQQRLVGTPVTSLRRDHQDRSLAVRLVDETGRFCLRGR